MVALDLFAGTGWGVACQWLGVEEHGVELMDEAVATRAANGMSTIYRDVWEGLERSPMRYDLLIASPPCQTFSMAGSGAGRRALDEVLGLIESGAYRNPGELRAFGEAHDPRTALVLTPLVHAMRDRPTYIVLEQVPPVLPVWQRIAVELESWGYSVVTGVLNAEQYGVPQTRRRAILVARADGKPAAMPTPTHSRYYSRDPKRLDPGVEPWVSMAEALGWGMTERPFVTAGNAVGRAEGIGGTGGKAAVNREKDRGAWEPAPGARYFHPMSYGRRGIWPGDEPAPTIRSVQRDMPETYTPHPRDAIVTDADEGMRGPWGMTERPYPTLSPGVGTGGRDPMGVGGSGARKTIDREKERGAWADERPATTVAGDSRIWPPGHKVNATDEQRLGKDEARERYGDRAGTRAERITVAEAAALQSYPPDFDWATGPGGRSLTKTKAFLQIGNAVPPLLARAILAPLVADFAELMGDAAE